MIKKSEKLSPSQKKTVTDNVSKIVLAFEDDSHNELTIQCQVTGKDIFTMLDGRKTSVDSHGKCRDCGVHFHIEGLKTGEGMSRSSWPISYVGYCCLECYNKPID